MANEERPGESNKPENGKPRPPKSAAPPRAGGAPPDFSVTAGRVPSPLEAIAAARAGDRDEFDAHEEVRAFCDAETGLRAIIAVHSTALGDSIGGCRFKPYPMWGAAMRNVLRLSKGMSFKNAMMGLPMGGAKSVIIGDPNRADKAALLIAFAKRVEEMGGRYWTAEDANVHPADIAVMAKHTKYVVGGPTGSGNPAPVTARGVVDGMRACVVQKGLGTDLKGCRIAILGGGAVGALIAEIVVAEGAIVTIADLDEAKAEKVAAAVGGRAVKVDDLWREPVDIFSPNTHGDAITEERARQVNAKIVAGAENNPLVTEVAGDILHEREVLYAPDYVINAGGLVSCYTEVAAIRSGASFDRTWMDAQVAKIAPNLVAVIETARKLNKPTHRVADEEARRRIGRAG